MSIHRFQTRLFQIRFIKIIIITTSGMGTKLRLGKPAIDTRCHVEPSKISSQNTATTAADALRQSELEEHRKTLVRDEARHVGTLRLRPDQKDRLSAQLGRREDAVGRRRPIIAGAGQDRPGREARSRRDIPAAVPVAGQAAGGETGVARSPGIARAVEAGFAD